MYMCVYSYVDTERAGEREMEPASKPPRIVKQIKQGAHLPTPLRSAAPA